MKAMKVMKVMHYLWWQSTSSPGSSPLIPCLQLQLSCPRFSLFFFFSSPFSSFFLSPLAPLLLFLSLPRPLPPPFLFLSLHLFESISVAATEEPAATVAWFPALWQKVTLSLAGKKKKKKKKGGGGEKGERRGEEEDERSDGGRLKWAGAGGGGGGGGGGNKTNRSCPQVPGAPGEMFQVRMKVETATSEEAFQVRRPRMLWGETRQRAYLCVKQLPFFFFFLRSSAAAHLWGKDNSLSWLEDETSEKLWKLPETYTMLCIGAEQILNIQPRPSPSLPGFVKTHVLHLWLRHLSTPWVPSITDSAGWPWSSFPSLPSSPSSGASGALVAAPSK